METLKTIFERRSIRRFEQKPILEDYLRDIVKAGAYAATGGNRQNWRFIAVAEAGKVAATTETLGWLNAWEPPEEERPVAHVVVLAPADASVSIKNDCAAAMQNMSLAAWDYGIGSCWFGSVKREKLTEVLGIPAEWGIYAVLALGYPAEKAGVVESGETKVTRDESGKVVVPKKPMTEVLSFDGF
ncbi:MAG: nitroreductase family protein [Planctomycetota bacterium]|jgi:nitroreductase